MGDQGLELLELEEVQPGARAQEAMTPEPSCSDLADLEGSLVAIWGHQGGVKSYRSCHLSRVAMPVSGFEQVVEDSKMQSL